MHISSSEARGKAVFWLPSLTPILVYRKSNLRQYLKSADRSQDINFVAWGSVASRMNKGIILTISNQFKNIVKLSNSCLTVLKSAYASQRTLQRICLEVFALTAFKTVNAFAMSYSFLGEKVFGPGEGRGGGLLHSLYWAFFLFWVKISDDWLQ